MNRLTQLLSPSVHVTQLNDPFSPRYTVQILDPILSMGGEDYGLPDMPVAEVWNQQLLGLPVFVPLVS
jgi:hypothetical protein